MPLAYCKQVGPWRVSKEVIGSGTTSTVHLASHITIPTLCAAIKIVSRSGLLLKAEGDPTALHLADAVIHREVLLMKLASHERIIKLYDFVGHGDLAYMILENAPNKTLFDLFRNYQSLLPIPLVTHLFSQLMHALEHLHSLHIVHRDIKLENVFLFGADVMEVLQFDYIQSCNHKSKHLLYNAKHIPTRTRNAFSPSYTDLTLKLGDFGLSHTHSPTALSTVFHGSPHYQAPELWARVPHRVFPTDVWSAGVVLFALIGRRLPFGVSELEEWGAVFDVDHNDKVDMNMHSQGHKNNEVKARQDCPIPRAGSPFHMPYDTLDIIPPPINHLLQRIFALNPAKRPTAREVLSDTLFSGSEWISSSLDVSASQGGKNRPSGHLAPPQHINADSLVPHHLYDLATLCTPSSIYVPRETFPKSSLERKVRKRLETEEECIEKVWAVRLNRWEPWEGEAGMEPVDKKSILGAERQKAKEKERGAHKERITEGRERKGWGKSLGRIKGADIRGHLATFSPLGHVGQRGKAEKEAAQPEHASDREMDLPALKPKISGSLSFRSLRIKAVQIPSEAKHSRPTARTPSLLASAFAPHNDATSITQFPPSSTKPKISFCTLPVKTSELHKDVTSCLQEPLSKVSFPKLRVKTSNSGHVQTPAQIPHSAAQTSSWSTFQPTLAQTVSPRQDAAIIRSRREAALALQSRHDALLRRAYELGFGAQDLRLFADEAGRIMRDAREEKKADGKNAVQDAEKDVTASSVTDGSSSAATTLIHENGGGEQKGIARVDASVAEIGRLGRKRALNVDVDVSFDVDFEKDLRWI